MAVSKDVEVVYPVAMSRTNATKTIGVAKCVQNGASFFDE
jgi:hypothetical protein